MAKRKENDKGGRDQHRETRKPKKDQGEGESWRSKMNPKERKDEAGWQEVRRRWRPIGPCTKVNDSRGVTTVWDTPDGSVDSNQVVKKFEACAAESIEWASRRELQFDTAKTEAALFTRRRGHKKHLRPKLTAKIKVGNSVVRFNQEAIRWLGVWMDAHLTFKEHHNRCLKKARAAEARLRTLTRMHGIVPEWLWWDLKETGRREDLQLLFNRQARSTLGALPMTPLGALMRESGLIPAAVALDSRQQRFTARLANACEGSKLKEMHDYLTSDAPICRVIKKEHERDWEAETMRWPNPDEELAVKTAILSDDIAAKREAIRWAREKEAKVGAGIWMWWTDGSRTDDGEWEPQQYASTETAGSPSAATSASDEWRSTIRSCGQSDSHSGMTCRRLFDERSTWSLGQGNHKPGGSIATREPSAKAGSKLRSTGFQDTPASPGMKRSIAKRTWPEKAEEQTRYENEYTPRLQIEPDGSPRKDRLQKHSGRLTSAASISAILRLKGKAGSKRPIRMTSVKSLAARFYRLKCGHAPTETYLKRFGHREDDKCW
ncbi:hypothetical protein BDD12DRAFT_900657 [Trichophaea hybrida]|nr:hypothetical protein BDD12DRAFT_900657 [Trichophaea hybrida]